MRLDDLEVRLRRLESFTPLANPVYIPEPVPVVRPLEITCHTEHTPALASPPVDWR